jgi:rubrerythrin
LTETRDRRKVPKIDSNILHCIVRKRPMALRIDFSNLSTRDILDMAIAIEEEAQQRYEEFADSLELHHTFEAAEFFHFMADNEEKHAATLRARRQEKFGDTASSVELSEVLDVEAPHYKEVRTGMSVHTALEAVRQAERRAHDFYAGAVAVVQDEKIKALLLSLQREEEAHEKQVEEQLANLPEAEEFDPDDFGDPPHAQ